MRLFTKDTNGEYESKIHEIEVFCNNYRKHEIFYINKGKELLKSLSIEMPNRKALVYDPWSLTFTVHDEKGDRIFSISEETFGIYSLFEDEELKEHWREAEELYVPGLTEVFAHGSTYHAMNRERIQASLNHRIYDYLRNFKYIEQKT